MWQASGHIRKSPLSYIRKSAGAWRAESIQQALMGPEQGVCMAIGCRLRLCEISKGPYPLGDYGVISGTIGGTIG